MQPAVTAYPLETASRLVQHRAQAHLRHPQEDEVDQLMGQVSSGGDVEVDAVERFGPLRSHLLPDQSRVLAHVSSLRSERFEARLLLPERRLPACSPKLLQRQRLDEVEDLARHTLLHVASMPRLWRDWLAQAGHGSLEPAATLTLDHFYLSIQAAVDGLGVAMAPSTLIEDDVRAGRLMTPFPHISLPSRSYFAYMPLGSPLRHQRQSMHRGFDNTPPTQIGEQ